MLSSLLTVAIVAGIAAYVWNKTHQTLKVTAATVSVANPGKIACNSTVDVVGTISTNGKGGPITYQWTKDGENLPTGTVTATSGQQQLRVELKWYLARQGNPPRRGDLPGLHAQRDLRPVRLLHLHVHPEVPSG